MPSSSRLSQSSGEGYIEGKVRDRYTVPVQHTVHKNIIKTVEVPVLRTVEKAKPERIENVIEVPVERIVEKVIENIIVKTLQVPIERIVEKIIEVPVEVPVERIIEKVVEVEVQVPKIQTETKIVEVPVEIVEEVIVEVPVEDIVEVTVPSAEADEWGIEELERELRESKREEEREWNRNQHLQEQVEQMKEEVERVLSQRGLRIGGKETPRKSGREPKEEPYSGHSLGLSRDARGGRRSSTGSGRVGRETPTSSRRPRTGAGVYGGEERRSSRPSSRLSSSGFGSEDRAARRSDSGSQADYVKRRGIPVASESSVDRRHSRTSHHRPSERPAGLSRSGSNQSLLSDYSRGTSDAFHPTKSRQEELKPRTRASRTGSDRHLNGLSSSKRSLR